MTLKELRDRVMRMPGVSPAVQATAGRGLLPRALWGRLQPSGVLTVRPMTGGSFRYQATSQDTMARQVCWTHLREWEPTTQPVLVDLARRARVFVDAGAYCGIYTLIATSANPELRVVAFEANPDTAELLAANLTINGLTDRVTVIREALGDEVGTAAFFIGADPTAAGLHGEGRQISVPATTADAHLADLPVDLVKIDVEGHEPAALRGMFETLTRCHPNLIVECLTSDALLEVRSVLRPLGYETCDYLGPDGADPVTETMEPQPRYANFLFRGR